ncbi:maleate cis-trans isomerase family protein [Tuwongella immobilis]|uniref:Arylmalonate decarboxylase n=1 Tax=Tuwongella immobilis TaxID=692036 RepID=A0A6C2YS88_9BACT|nr:hypothetical protein [Tuwongella immobilis]VIP04538.1 arylmalonate decarboxylase : Arylmalonate decarboxylase OS=Roseobacter sp. AzwK-3b GN=RAZWK3B_09896 PE=4 SV=1: Asp_Glu_race [Tuwongella immobilis]VTS06437.1 arylmalonate decarboxylase : Arylmalonate decarboxylase OS=Roseobacter sp. AzwK-3b GN=RAZWK3B_09896 PE=4 SV=1: Asp_Glu_race [Tuwongella immobilis]
MADVSPPALPLALPDVDAPPMPAFAPRGIVQDGVPLPDFVIDSQRGYPDVRSFRRKFGLLLPATNTSMEYDLWEIIFRNSQATLHGVGLHTTPILTPRPTLQTHADLLAYREQIVTGTRTAAETARLAKPHAIILGMSMEHILPGLAPIRESLDGVRDQHGIPWATWHDAISPALQHFQARRIGLLTPFDAVGNTNAAKLFTDLGFEVVTTFGFACADALHIAHVPDWAKERAILERLAPRGHRLDAIVQCGTNFSIVRVAERLEPQIGIPILGINPVTFWHALRLTGITGPILGGTRLLREATGD